MSYLRDPAAIYAQSFATIRHEADLSHLAASEWEVAVRVVHACGMVEVAQELAISPGFSAAARGALARGASIFVDAEMTRHGIIARHLPAGCEIVCTLNDRAVAANATALGTTRSAAAVDLWRGNLGGSVVVIGNAPTALFRLLEILADGAARPDAIIGFPVGFVGAAESKAALIANPWGIPFATLPGRKGGSAMAAAAFNAIMVTPT